LVRTPREPRAHLAGRGREDLHPEEARERRRRLDLCRQLRIGLHESGGYPPSVSTETASVPALERTWWLRAPAVLVAPRAIFASLRDDTNDAVEARQEPLLTITVLAGIAVVLVSP